jgi:hypothetical protein
MNGFQRISYDSLNSRQQEAFNFQKVSAVLADYGFITIRLSNDWGGADFIAQHSDGQTFLKVQLKSRLTFQKQYLDRDLHVCFPHGGEWFIYPHDVLLREILSTGRVGTTDSWTGKRGEFSFPRLSRQVRKLLEPYRLKATEARGIEETD